MPSSRLTIVYFHGGGYVFGPLVFHWLFCARLARELRCRVCVVRYPLAPEHSAAEALRAAVAAYTQARARCNAQPVVLVGDSAGGGLALSLAQHLAAATASRRSGEVGAASSAVDVAGVEASAVPQADALVLISPWVDATLDEASDPDGFAASAAADKMLSAAALREAGRWYAGAGCDPAAPPASPLRGAFEGLPCTGLWIGTQDVLLTSCRALRARWMERSASTLAFHEARLMQHDFCLLAAASVLPFPEAELSFLQILQFIRKHCDV